MSATSKDPRPSVLNVPNQITAARLVLALVDFALMMLGLYPAAFVVFLVAASTDWLDGYYARRYGQVTKLGRVCDPFVDKVIVCGLFIFLAATPASGIVSWMAVLVVARELLVTTLRTFIEGSGGDFSAKTAGKWKMVLQCITIGVSLAVLSCGGVKAPLWMQWLLVASVWIAMISTVQSGFAYVVAAWGSIVD